LLAHTRSPSRGEIRPRKAPSPTCNTSLVQPFCSCKGSLCPLPAPHPDVRCGLKQPLERPALDKPTPLTPHLLLVYASRVLLLPQCPTSPHLPTPTSTSPQFHLLSSYPTTGALARSTMHGHAAISTHPPYSSRTPPLRPPPFAPPAPVHQTGVGRVPHRPINHVARMPSLPTHPSLHTPPPTPSPHTPSSSHLHSTLPLLQVAPHQPLPPAMSAPHPHLSSLHVQTSHGSVQTAHRVDITSRYPLPATRRHNSGVPCSRKKLG